MIEYIAVYGHGSWGGESRVHAADPATYDPGTRRYRSRCGQRYMLATGGTNSEPVLFSTWMHLEQCQRCVTLLAGDASGGRKDCRGAGEHIGRTQGGARWRNRGTCSVCGKDLALTSSGRIPRHVPKATGD